MEPSFGKKGGLNAIGDVLVEEEEQVKALRALVARASRWREGPQSIDGLAEVFDAEVRVDAAGQFRICVTEQLLEVDETDTGAGVPAGSGVPQAVNVELLAQPSVPNLIMVPLSKYNNIRAISQS
jgi:hypothetical protein